MKQNNNPNGLFFLYSMLLLVCIIIVFYAINYIGYEGFNPSDHGVVLAQSFRILNGEIFHKDFISIRPVFSGILHVIHFYSPLPLETSARWFVLFEFIIISFVWAYILYKGFLEQIIAQHNKISLVTEKTI